MDRFLSWTFSNRIDSIELSESLNCISGAARKPTLSRRKEIFTTSEWDFGVRRRMIDSVSLQEEDRKRAPVEGSL